MNYIFINPVVDKMYIKEELDEFLLSHHYLRVNVEHDWHQIVKEKYEQVLKTTTQTLLDARCPLAVSTISKYLTNESLKVANIDPILIHCGIEIANRADLKGKKKVITTPCESLAIYGNNLKLEDTIFISWKQFIKSLPGYQNIQVKTLEKSPIPPGYFNSLKVNMSSLSGEEKIEEFFENKQYQENDLVEMLYCHNGCNNGDGVLMNE